MSVFLEIVILPKTNNLVAWKFQRYLIKLASAPDKEEVILKLNVRGQSETVSEGFKIKSTIGKGGVLLLKSAHTIVSDNFYQFVERYCQKMDNDQP